MKTAANMAKTAAATDFRKQSRTPAALRQTDAKLYGFSGGACLAMSTAGIVESAFPGLGRELWFVRLLSVAAALILAALIMFLYRRLPSGKSRPLKPWGRIWLFLAAFAAMALSGFCLWGLAGLWMGWTVDSASRWLLTLSMTGLCAYGCISGQRSILRLSLLMVAGFFLLALTDTLLPIGKMQFSRLSVSIPGKEALTPGLTMLCVFLLPVVLLSVHTEENGSRLPAKNRLFGYWAGLGYFACSGIRSVLLLGSLTKLVPIPLLRALQTVGIGDGLPHVEFFGILALLSTALLGIMLIMETASALLARSCALSPRPAILLSAGAVLLFQLPFFQQMTALAPFLLIILLLLLPVNIILPRSPENS